MVNNENSITVEQLEKLIGTNLGTTTEVELPTTFIEEEGQEEEDNNEGEDPIVEAETTEEITLTGETEAYKATQFLIKSGQLEDLEVEIEGETFKLSEAKNLDEETLTAVLQEYNKVKNEELKKDKLDVSNLTDMQTKLINIIKDGDFTKAKELFSNPEKLVEPFQGYDPTNEEHNAEVFLQDLMARNPKMTQKKALALLEIEKSEGTLDETSQQLVDSYREAFNKSLEETEKRVKAEKEEAIKKEKEFIKGLNSIYKQEEIKDSVALQMTKLAQRDKEGKRPIDSIVQEVLSDPQKASDLIMFLSNKELYDKKITAKVKNETEVGFAKKINIIKSKPTINNEEKAETSSQNFTDVFGKIKLK